MEIKKGSKMVKKSILLNILYAGAGIVIMVVLQLTLILIPCIIFDKSPQAAPAGAVFGTLMIVMMHLPTLYGFREAIIINKRNGHPKRIVLIATGTGLFLLGLIIMDGAFAFRGHVDMRLASVIMFICVGFNFLASVIAFTALLLQPSKNEFKGNP
jgi:hypothetical protein